MTHSPLLIVASLVVALGAVACARPATHRVCPTAGAADYHFPAGLLVPTNADADELSREWYSKHLNAMGEPSLSCGTPEWTIRFTWLRTFHHPIVVRVANVRGEYRITATELDGAGGYEPGRVLRRQEAALIEADLRELQATVRRTQVANLPATDDRFGLDGAQWIIEIATNDSYRAVNRWSPESGPVREVGLLLLRLSTWSVDPSATY
jgi:hypothetical protein